MERSARSVRSPSAHRCGSSNQSACGFGIIRPAPDQPLVDDLRELARIAAAGELLIASFQSGGKLLLCGNGGSAADCQHIAAEFVSALNHDRPRAALGAIALTTDTSFLTANANDFGFERVFERQVEALGRRGDVLLGRECSPARRRWRSATAGDRARSRSAAQA